jgi:hypothetical protein
VVRALCCVNARTGCVFIEFLTGTTKPIQRQVLDMNSTFYVSIKQERTIC